MKCLAPGLQDKQQEIAAIVVVVVTVIVFIFSAWRTAPAS